MFQLSKAGSSSDTPAAREEGPTFAWSNDRTMFLGKYSSQVAPESFSVRLITHTSFTGGGLGWPGGACGSLDRLPSSQVTVAGGIAIIRFRDSFLADRPASDELSVETIRMHMPGTELLIH